MDVSWHLERSIPVTETGCWLWTGAGKGNGYGNVRHNGSYTTAHRVAFEKAVGPVPDGMDVCHKCDVRLCINPAHLFLGSRAENMQDAKEKGRVAHGERLSRMRRGALSSGAKLNQQQVDAIRGLIAAGADKNRIATVAKVTVESIRSIAANRTWKEQNKCEA